MERHWTKNLSMIKEGWKEDESPLSLIALELRCIDQISFRESMVVAKVLSRIALKVNI